MRSGRILKAVIEPERMESKGKDMSVREAGKKGGQRTAETHDHSFYSNIGQKGGHKGGQRVRELIQEGKRQEQR